MKPFSILLLIGLPSALGVILAIVLLSMLRRHCRVAHEGRHPPDKYCAVLETDIIISCGMALTIQLGVAVGASGISMLSETPLPAPGVFSIARMTGMFVFSTTISMAAFLLRRILWRLGRHPAQIADVATCPEGCA